MKEMKVLQKGKEGESCFCRECNFSLCDIKSGCLARAKYHHEKTGHTVDVYYESWRIVTNKWFKKS